MLWMIGYAISALLLFGILLRTKPLQTGTALDYLIDNTGLYFIISAFWPASIIVLVGIVIGGFFVKK